MHSDFKRRALGRHLEMQTRNSSQRPLINRLHANRLYICTLSWNARVYLISEPRVDEAGDFVWGGSASGGGGEVVFELAQDGTETIGGLGP